MEIGTPAIQDRPPNILLMQIVQKLRFNDELDRKQGSFKL